MQFQAGGINDRYVCHLDAGKIDHVAANMRKQFIFVFAAHDGLIALHQGFVKLVETLHFRLCVLLFDILFHRGR